MTDPTQLKRKLLADTDTQSIAKTLGVELEEYVARVVSYAMDPAREPEVEFDDEASARVSDAELGAALVDLCETREDTDSSFSAHQRPLMVI
ncbi:MAG: hypothetical protein JNK82_19965 [Myxococcaceae bacterium]|nr:hypothetical protein [Myxococcaceae bacterium]